MFAIFVFFTRFRCPLAIHYHFRVIHNNFFYLAPIVSPPPPIVLPPSPLLSIPLPLLSTPLPPIVHPPSPLLSIPPPHKPLV